jgi:hypothetical protein
MSAKRKTQKMSAKCWCRNLDADEKNREANVPIHDVEDGWDDYAFDLSDVMTLKRTRPNEFIEEGEATSLTFFTNDVVIVNIAFDVLYPLWLDI